MRVSTNRTQAEGLHRCAGPGVRVPQLQAAALPGCCHSVSLGLSQSCHSCGPPVHCPEAVQGHPGLLVSLLTAPLHHLLFGQTPWFRLAWAPSPPQQVGRPTSDPDGFFRWCSSTSSGVSWSPTRADLRSAATTPAHIALEHSRRFSSVALAGRVPGHHTAQQCRLSWVQPSRPCSRASEAMLPQHQPPHARSQCLELQAVLGSRWGC